MRNVLVLALLASVATTTACTRHSTVRRGEPLPENETHHAMGALTGAGIGALAGGLGGYAVGYSAGDDDPCTEGDGGWNVCIRFSAEEKGMLVGVPAAAAGAAVGALIGGVVGIKDDYRYEDPRVPMISTRIAPGQAGATASWRF